MFPKGRGNLIYMQHGGSLPRANCRRTREESCGPCRHTRTCKMHRSAFSRALLLQHFLCMLFQTAETHAAAAGWPTFSELRNWSFRSALLRWPRGRSRTPMRLIPLSPILRLTSDVQMLVSCQSHVLWHRKPSPMLFFAVGRNPGLFMKIKCMNCGGLRLGFIPTFPHFSVRTISLYFFMRCCLSFPCVEFSVRFLCLVMSKEGVGGGFHYCQILICF